MQLKSSLLTVKVLELTFYLLGWCNFLVVSGFLLELGFVGELWGLGREPAPAPARYRVPPFCPRTVVALPQPEAAQPGEQGVQNSSGVHGVPGNREPLRMRLTMCKRRLQTFLGLLPLKLRPLLGFFSFYCSWARNRYNLNRWKRYLHPFKGLNYAFSETVFLAQKTWYLSSFCLLCIIG